MSAPGISCTEHICYEPHEWGDNRVLFQSDLEEANRFFIWEHSTLKKKKQKTQFKVIDIFYFKLR